MKTCDNCQLQKELTEFPNRRNSKYCKFCREEINKEANKDRSKKARARIRERLALVDGLERKIQEMTDNMDKIQGEIDRLVKLNSDYMYENNTLKMMIGKN